MAVKEGCRVWCVDYQSENSCPWCHLRDRRLSRRSCSALWRKLCCKLEIKGEVRRFFLFVQSFYWPKTKTSFNRQFSPKRPKLVKNQAKGSEIHQIRTKWHPSYCGNPSILSSDLAVKIKRSLQGSPVENKMLRSWMFFALPPKHPTSEHFIFNR